MERRDHPIQTIGLNRVGGRKRTVETEAYFTTDALARRCVEFVERIAPVGLHSFILEPSAGAGAFLRALPADGVVAIDIEPRAEGIAAGDFFGYEPPCMDRGGLVIGNPPFGQRGALAMRFLDHAMEFAATVAFILPRSFKKHTFLNRIDPWFHLMGQFDCDEFVSPEGEAITVRSVFQVWRRQTVERTLIEFPAEHEDFEMKHFHLSRTSSEQFALAVQEFDFAIAQVGSNFAPVGSVS